MSELFWRLLPDVRRAERSPFLFFAGLSTLISLAQTFGLAGSEALFLAELGAGELPPTFIAASALTVLGSVVYATRVGVARNDRLFVQMLLGAALVLAGLAIVTRAGALWALPALVCAYYLAQAVFLNHFWTFTGDYFDTLTSKRLFPLFTVGASIGGALGGGLAALLTVIAGPVSLIGAWAASLVAGAALLQLGRRGLRRWGPLELEESDETSVEGIQGAVRYLRGSSLGLWLVLSALGMVIALFIAQYLYSDIFTRSFPSAAALASFFGVYLAVTNGIEIAIELGVTPWLIRRVGVASANLLHPVLTLLSFGGMAYQYQLWSGVGARANRELMENAMAGPLRSLVYNAMPMRFRGRMRAFLEGIVVYAGMSIAGFVLLALGEPDPLWLCGAGAAVSLVYLGANVMARREYLRALIAELRAGRLDLADVGDEIGRWEAARLAELWEQHLRQESGRPSRSLLQLIPNLAARGITEPLVRALAHPSPEVRRACVNALASSPAAAVESPLAGACGDVDPRVRLAALRGLTRRDPEAAGQAPLLRRLARDPDPQVRCEAALRLGDEGAAALEAMIRSADPAEAVAALGAAPPPLLEAALSRLRDPEPPVRAAALECAARIAPDPPLELEELEKALVDEDPRVRRAAVLLLAQLDDPEAPPAIASALADASPEVHFAAEQVLGSLGEEGVRAVAPKLRSDQERVVEAALRVVSACGTPRAREHLAAELRHRVRQLWFDIVAYQLLLGAGRRLPVRFLRAAYRDALLRNQRLAFRVLERIENPSVVRKLEKALRLGSSRSRADALEVLSNLGDREAAELLVSMFDRGDLADRTRRIQGRVATPAGTQDVLAAARASETRWIRMAAAAYDLPDGETSPEEPTMDRLLALKQVPLFQHLSLEQLDAVLGITREVDFVSGEVIVREGDPGGELFLLIEGSVRFHKRYGTPEATLLGSAEAISYFGEMAALDDEERSATVVAASRARLLSLDGGSLKELILQMPEISFEIVRVLTHRVRTAEERMGGKAADSESRPPRSEA